MTDGATGGIDGDYAGRLVRAVVEERTLAAVAGTRGAPRRATFVTSTSPAAAVGPRGADAKPVVTVETGPDGAPALSGFPGMDVATALRVRDANRRMSELHAALERAGRDRDVGFATPRAAGERAATAMALTPPETLGRLLDGLHMPRGGHAVTVENPRAPTDATRKVLPEDYGVTSHVVDVVSLDRQGRAVARKPAVLVVDEAPAGGGGPRLALAPMPVFGAARPNPDVAAFNAGLAQPWAGGREASATLAADALRASGRPRGSEPRDPETATVWVTREDLASMSGRVPTGTRRERDLALLAYAVAQPVYDGARPTGVARTGAAGVEMLAEGFGAASRTRGLVLDARRVEALAVAGGPAVEDALLRLAGTNLERSAERDRSRAVPARAATRPGAAMGL